MICPSVMAPGRDSKDLGAISQVQVLETALRDKQWSSFTYSKGKKIKVIQLHICAALHQPSDEKESSHDEIKGK